MTYKRDNTNYFSDTIQIQYIQLHDNTSDK